MIGDLIVVSGQWSVVSGQWCNVGKDCLSLHGANRGRHQREEPSTEAKDSK